MHRLAQVNRGLDLCLPTADRLNMYPTGGALIVVRLRNLHTYGSVHRTQDATVGPRFRLSFASPLDRSVYTCWYATRQEEDANLDLSV